MSQLFRLQQIQQNSLARTVVKAPKSCHITPILRSLHWLRITECIEYKLLSLTYKVLTTTQPPYLHNKKSSQYSFFIRRYFCSAAFIILSKNNWSLLSLCFALSLESNPSITSSTSLWYQFLRFRFIYSFTRHFVLCRFTTVLIHNSLPKNIHVSQILPRSFTASSRTAFMDYCQDRFFWATRFLFLVFPYFFVFV